MSIARGYRHGRSAAAVLAVAVLLLASLHSLIPHHRFPGACHECETLASPALLPQPQALARPVAPALAPPRRPDTRPDDLPSTRLRPTRAPPAPLAA